MNSYKRLVPGLRGADQHRLVGEEPQPARARAGGARHGDAHRAADAGSVVQSVSRARRDAAVGPRRDRAEDRSRAADQQEHLRDEPPRAAAPADRRAAGQPERGARRAREGRPGARDARRAPRSSISWPPSARSGTTTSSTSRRGRSSGTWRCTDRRSDVSTRRPAMLRIAGHESSRTFRTVMDVSHQDAWFPAAFCVSGVPAGMRFDASVCGRVGSTGCVTSGRRWHRRIPPFVSRSGAALSRILTMKTLLPASPSSPHSHAMHASRLCAIAGQLQASPTCSTTPAVTRTARSRIDGVVTSSWGLPLVPFRFYKVDDGTGEVTVMSQDAARLPTRDACARQRTGRTRSRCSAASALGLHLRERDLDVKR